MPDGYAKEGVMERMMKRLLRSSALLAFVLAAGCSGAGNQAALSGSAAMLAMSPVMQAELFSDHFMGTAIDPVRWNTSIATSGARWALPSSIALDGLWGWIDPSASTDPSIIQAAPYGAIAVTRSLASFAAGAGRCAPFIWAPGPGQPSPFPTTGDFVFEMRLRWDSVARSGPWVLLQDNPD